MLTWNKIILVFYLFKHKVHKENTTQSTEGSNLFVLFVKNLCALGVKISLWFKKLKCRTLWIPRKRNYISNICHARNK